MSVSLSCTSTCPAAVRCAPETVYSLVAVNEAPLASASATLSWLINVAVSAPIRTAAANRIVSVSQYFMSGVYHTAAPEAFRVGGEPIQDSDGQMEKQVFI